MLRSLQPNVAVVDITMPGMDGLELARQTCESSLNTSVVIYSLYESKAYVLEAMRAGAKACVSKTSSLSQLVLAIREVAAGGTYFSRPFPNPPRGRAQRRRKHWRDYAEE
jgi:DNA-binding NarL/FixJ family response regulator